MIRRQLDDDARSGPGTNFEDTLMMPTLGEAMARVGRHFGKRPAMRDSQGETNWRDFGDRITVTAGLLRGLGIKSGERVAI